MHGITPAIRVALGAAALAAALHARAEPTIAPTPARPVYGQAVMVDLLNTIPYFLPSMRYTREGNSFTVEYEAAQNAFGPFPPSLGTMPLSLGELAPGDYTVTARVFDMDRPQTMLSVATTAFSVAPPTDYGVYTVPTVPHAYDNLGVVLRSAAYFDPSTVHVTMGPSNIRVDYVFDPSLAVSAPPGEQNYATVHTGSLPPGPYHIEVWAHPTTGGPTLKYFERDIVVGSASVVVEYYNPALDHYFISAGQGEIAMLDAGQQGGWKRTGQTFAAWPSASLAPPQAQPVCRFYAKGPNSHFYTADAKECEQLKEIESAQRAQASGTGSPFLGWAYEGIAFYALLPDGNGTCPGGTTPVYRAYNGRALQNDSNHRFMPDSQVRNSMTGWMQEGVAFCTPA